MSSDKEQPAPAAPSVQFSFDNTYARLPERFYARQDPVPVAQPRLIKLNETLAAALGLDPAALATGEGVAILAGNRVAQGSEPLAEAYAGHQFGHFVPRLGDGRANLLGEVMGRDGQRYDIQLKGSGRTAFSRGGDGRAAVGPVLREYLISEAMAALGIPTTRTLAAVTTGELVMREEPLPGAILTRVAASHLRVGTFEYFAARRDVDGLRTLANYALARHYPAAGPKASALLQAVLGRQARLVAQWMCLGFIHGVMNTDNTSISGETIDYGPCAFMEAYDPATVFSAIDQQGRYAYGNQPRIALWNLARLAESLLPLILEEEGSEQAALELANHALSSFAEQYDEARLAGMRRKLGLFTVQQGDADLVEDLLEKMAANQADFTLTFRRLSQAALSPENDAPVRALFAKSSAFDDWAATWRQRIAAEPIAADQRSAAMRAANPLFIPRNHRVEAALKAATENADYQPFEKLLDVLEHPYEDRPEREEFALPALPQERVRQTFCGT